MIAAHLPPPQAVEHFPAVTSLTLISAFLEHCSTDSYGKGTVTPAQEVTLRLHFGQSSLQGTGWLKTLC